MVGVNNLLLNILLTFVMIFCYYYLDILKSKPIRQAVLSILTIGLCMTFPFAAFPGYIFDFRMIPLLIAWFYGGFGVGLFVTGFLFLYRFFLGGDGFFVALLTYTILVSLASFFVPTYKYYTRLKKVIVAVSLSFTGGIIISLYSFMRLNHLGESVQLGIPFFIEYTLLHSMIMWMAILLIETLSENERMRNELRQVEKMQVVGELAAAIAHEVRNPMTVVRGFTQLLKEQQQDQRYYDLILTEVDRAESIINDYLSYAKPRVSCKDLVDLKKELLQIINILSTFAVMSKVQIEYQLEEKLSIQADSKKLAQALVNIIKNAIESMPNGGLLQVKAYRTFNRICIEIQDTGVGMSKEEITRLGNPFYSTKEKGTGLGLMITYRIIEAMNGKIRVKSKKGTGTTFFIEFSDKS